MRYRVEHRRWLLATILAMVVGALFVSDSGRLGLIAPIEFDQVTDDLEECDDQSLVIPSPSVVLTVHPFEWVEISGPERFALVNSWRVHSERGPPRYFV